jgi:hypothetical protein
MNRMNKTSISEQERTILVAERCGKCKKNLICQIVARYLRNEGEGELVGFRKRERDPITLRCSRYEPLFVSRSPGHHHKPIHIQMRLYKEKE